MAAELDEFNSAKLLAVRAMGRKGEDSLFTAIFPFELDNPFPHNVLFTSASFANNCFTIISTSTYTDLYKSHSAHSTEGTMMVSAAHDFKIGVISREVIFGRDDVEKQFLIQYVDNLCVNIYRCADGTYGTHAATIVGNEANEVVVLNYMDIPMTVNEKILVLFATLRMFRSPFCFDKKPMRSFLTFEREKLRELDLEENLNVIWTPDELLLRPYGYLNKQSKVIEILVQGGNVICTATQFFSDGQLIQRVQSMTGKVIYKFYGYNIYSYDGKICTKDGMLIGKVVDKVIVIFNRLVPDMEITCRKTEPMMFFIRRQNETGDGHILARIFEGAGKTVRVAFSPQLSHIGRHGAMYVAILYAITEFKIFDGVLPTVHHYPFAS